MTTWGCRWTPYQQGTANQEKSVEISRVEGGAPLSLIKQAGLAGKSKKEEPHEL